MKFRNLLFVLPLLAACESEPFSTPVEAGAPALRTFSYSAPITAEGFLTGADGVQLNYRVVGTGPDTVVVLHGGPGLTFRYMANDFAPLANGRTLIFYDQRGAGHSQLIFDPALLTVDRQVADLEAVRQHFGLQKMKLVGHSWGAMLAPFYAAAHPDRVERMVLVTPGPATRAYDAQFTANRVARTSAEDLARQGELIGLLASGTSPDPVATCEELLLNLFGAYFYDPVNFANRHSDLCDVPAASANALLFTLTVGQAALGPDYDMRPMMATIAAPSLVIHGAADPIPFESTQDFATSLQNAELEVIQEAGHFPWLENPVAFFTAVNTFLHRGDL